MDKSKPRNAKNLRTLKLLYGFYWYVPIMTNITWVHFYSNSFLSIYSASVILDAIFPDNGDCAKVRG